MKITPFFINSNICFEDTDIKSFERFMNAVAGNTGNSYITYSLIKELFGGLTKVPHIQNIYSYNFDNSQTDIDYINNESSHVILILQDQIRIKESYGLKLPYKKIIKFLKQLNKPIIISGIGINAFGSYDVDFYKKLDSELIKFLKFLSESCIEIGVRGYYSQDVLNKLGIKNTRAIGCPSFYETGKNRIIKKKEITDLKSVLLTSDINCFTNNIKTIMQDFCEEDIIKLVAFNRIGNNFSSERIDEFYNEKYNIFSNIDDWKHFVSTFNFALGYRLHGAILAINSGVPALCLNGDVRAQEMCNLLKIPNKCLADIKNEEDIFKIYEDLDYSDLNNNYNKLYNNFTEFLHKNGLVLFEENKNINQKIKYIEQPKLNLYNSVFFTNIQNIIYLKNCIKRQIFSFEKTANHFVLYILGSKIKIRYK